MTDCQRLIPPCLDFFKRVEIREREGEGDEVLLLTFLRLLEEASFSSSKRNWMMWEREDGG